MNKERFYTVIIIALLVLNIGTLTFLFIKERQVGPRQEPKDIIIQRLDLNEQQQKQFRELRMTHHSRMLQLQRESGQVHHDLFATLKNGAGDTTSVNNLLEQISSLQDEQERVTYEHFKSLRGILQPRQQASFDELIDDIAGRVLRDHQGNGHRPPPPPRP